MCSSKKGFVLERMALKVQTARSLVVAVHTRRSSRAVMVAGSFGPAARIAEEVPATAGMPERASHSPRREHAAAAAPPAHTAKHRMTGSPVQSVAWKGTTQAQPFVAEEVARTRMVRTRTHSRTAGGPEVVDSHMAKRAVVVGTAANRGTADSGIAVRTAVVAAVPASSAQRMLVGHRVPGHTSLPPAKACLASLRAFLSVSFESQCPEVT